MWLKEKEEILEYCLSANDPPDDFFEEEEVTGEQGSKLKSGSRSREPQSKDSLNKPTQPPQEPGKSTEPVDPNAQEQPSEVQTIPPERPGRFFKSSKFML